MTTRRRNFGVFNGLGYKFDSLTTLLLCLGVLGSDLGILATPGLPSGRLPAADLPPALWLLTVALVPTSRVVLPTALFVDASSLARTARSGFGTAFFFTVVVAHGRFGLPRESSGRMR